MFRMISIIIFLVVLGGIGLHGLMFSHSHLPKKHFSLGQNNLWFSRFKKLVFLVGMLSFCILFLTGFGPLLFASRLHGYLLMIHATFAPVFIACTAFIAITGSAQYAFNKKDIKHIPCLCWKLPNRADGCWLSDTGIGAKTGFWILLVMSLPVALTMVLSMLPLFGPEGQEFLFNAHRWCALVFGLTAIVEAYILMRIEVLKDTKR
jgi:hypothetical protein